MLTFVPFKGTGRLYTFTHPHKRGRRIPFAEEWDNEKSVRIQGRQRAFEAADISIPACQ